MKQARVNAPLNLSDAMLLALNDLAVVESMPKIYKVEMGQWHVKADMFNEDSEQCNLCFAGSVMANTLKVDSNEEASPYQFQDSWKNVFLALNQVRTGGIYDALAYMGYDHDVIENFLNGEIEDLNQIKVVRYDENPEEFKEQMLEIAMMLQVNGF